ncbi:hypothetical protein P0Y35_09295 [Kiritimatiellaeota bacterium B1221]|nr:hypothetical protein [Kiritimatiellaeota bacterium B1221]
MKALFSKLKYRLLATVIFLGAAGYAVRSFIDYKEDPVRIWRNERLALVRERVEGFVVFERLSEKNKGIWIQKLGHDRMRRLTTGGRFPRFSPDGETIFFLRGDNEVYRISKKGGDETKLLEWEERIPGIAVHPKNSEILFISASGIWRLNLETLDVTKLEAAPESPAAIDLDEKMNIIISTYEGRHHRIWKQQTEDIRHSAWERVEPGCSAALSPDGKLFSDNNNRHTYMEIKSFKTNEVLHQVQTYPENYLVDNEAWTNLNDWMVFNSDTTKHRFAYLYRMGDEHSLMVTFTWDSDRPDAFITRVLDPSSE